MKITVLNGSPKGDISVTMQYVHFIQKEFPEHELTIFNISNRIKKIEKDKDAFQDILDSIQFSEGIIFASPVYYMLVPANYKRFIELLFEQEVGDVFNEKPAVFLTTSIHFYDHTAHNYMHAICDDLNMRYVGSFSADMYDLVKPEERERIRLLSINYFNQIRNETFLQKSYMPIKRRLFKYAAGKTENKVSIGNNKILIITDSQDDQINLTGMIERFKASFLADIEVVNLWDLNIGGSCLGCIQCGYGNQCIYEGKDDYNEFYSTKVSSSDILIWAGTVQDRYLSSRWKMFIDRSFFNGHAPSLKGKQVGFIIAGPLGQVPNLRQILEAHVEAQHANLCGFVTDEYGESEDIDNLLQGLAENLVQFADTSYIKPKTFLGVAGTKIFRDEIWGRLRFPFRADHVAYKKLRVYDFPQKKHKVRIQNTIMLMLSKSPGFRKEVNKRMKQEMIKPLQKILKD